MVFEVKDKVALITGGASGIGLNYAKELIQNGIEGITLADVNPQFGEAALRELEKEFGSKKAIFIITDVTDIRQYEDAFKKTIETYGHIDILFNNAGIFDDSSWQKEVAINVNGVIHGMILGIDNYLQKYKKGSEALIVNTASVASIGLFNFMPVYCGTKAAVTAMTRNWGTPQHYQRSKVKVIAVCPGVTNTPLFLNMSGRNLGQPYEKICSEYPIGLTQEPEHLASEVMKVVKNANNGTIWVIEGGKPAYQYIFPERRLDYLTE